MGGWIWLDKNRYPEYQNTFINVSGFDVSEHPEYKFAVAEFKKRECFQKKIKKIKLFVSGDTFYRFYINGELVGMGPPAAGGDFSRICVMPYHYANTYELEADTDTFEILAQVRLMPQVLTDYSRTHGGFFAAAELVFSDGSSQNIVTGEDWQARLASEFYAPFECDMTLASDSYEQAALTEDIWNAQKAPIPPLTYEPVYSDGGEFEVMPGEEKSVSVLFDRIYSAYIKLDGCGVCDMELIPFELSENDAGHKERLITNGRTSFLSHRMYSAGGCAVKIKNTGTEKASFTLSLISSYYPVGDEGSFESSDKELDAVYDVCKHTLKICRQSLHLDSPKHQELLACTGDYYIQTLMTAFTFGDMRLAAFDIKRTADWLTHNNGVMFHSTYSMIWFQMIYDVYMFTGDKSLIEYCAPAMRAVIKRFTGYMDESGVIQNASDYMFVDWVVFEGYSMHHPPKALGQTVLNVYFYGALKNAVKLFSAVGDNGAAAEFESLSRSLKRAVNELFYDGEKGLYFDGLPGETPEGYYYLPQNTDIKHFSYYPNILASLYGLHDDPAALLVRTLESGLARVQPYFMHFVLEAVNKLGLNDEYAMKLLSLWKPLAEECSKGLKEGWMAPEPSYSFDHSHAWGGTPCWQLPRLITGFEMLEPGFEKIRLRPCLYGLERAKIVMPTPKGRIVCRLERDKKPYLEIPDNINCILE